MPTSSASQMVASSSPFTMPIDLPSEQVVADAAIIEGGAPPGGDTDMSIGEAETSKVLEQILKQ